MTIKGGVNQMKKPKIRKPKVVKSTVKKKPKVTKQPKKKRIRKRLTVKQKTARKARKRKARGGHASKFQYRIYKVLKALFANVDCEVKFRGLVGVTGRPLRVDFYVPEWNLAVEADGIQHSDPNHKWAKRKGGRLKIHDEYKNQYFKDNNILLCRIPYTRRVIHDEVKELIKGILFV